MRDLFREIVGCTAKISESICCRCWTHPFRIAGFHADNGTDYINGRVTELLNKLLCIDAKAFEPRLRPRLDDVASSIAKAQEGLLSVRR